mgnify:CR=1 FL=1
MKSMPVIFIGHGSPMNMVLDNEYTRSLTALRDRLPLPKAIVIISAHWQTSGTHITDSPNPRQIYDFYGFPQELYDIRYEPLGAPPVARKAHKLMGGEAEGVLLDDSWGDDHAGWAVLKFLYPNADIPITVISVDMEAPASRHATLAQRLAPLREEEVLILASGNIVHNLFDADLMNENAPPDQRGLRFDALAKSALETGDLDSLVHYERWGGDARYSVPTRDHYLPLLWAAALKKEHDSVTFPCEVMQNRSVSMRSVVFGL